MKLYRIFAVMMALTLLLTGCGSQPKEKTGTPTEAQVIDVDLTQLSSTMVYSEVYNMVNTPEDYIGKTVKMGGQFALYTNADETQNYYAVVIADATSCCSQGLEFVLAGDASYPEDYPELGTEVAVTGVFETYDEDGVQYCHLVDAEMDV